MAPPRRHLRPRLLPVLLTVAALGAVADYWLYPRLARPHMPTPNRGENGLWLRYTWYFGEKTEPELRRLAVDLRRRQVRYAYFHLRHVDRSGRLVYRYSDRARRLVRVLHELAPGVRVMAWVYVGNAIAHGPVDLAGAGVRRNLVSEAVWLTRDCGFDGVQWDYETCKDGDPGLPLLLRETRGALPSGKLIGVAAAPWLPWHRWGWGWSEAYCAEVARECDQLAVMCYDTGMHTPRAYAWLLRQECRRVLPTVAQANPQCRVLLGLPTYGRGVPAHNPRAENLPLALTAVRNALGRPAPPASFAGVALFADYTTESAEWAAYERTWLGR